MTPYQAKTTKGDPWKSSFLETLRVERVPVVAVLRLCRGSKRDFPSSLEQARLQVFLFGLKLQCQAGYSSQEWFLKDHSVYMARKP